MDVRQFKTIGYFVKSYYNWSVDKSELERCIEDFFASENEEKKEAFRKEIETIYALHDSDLIREVTYRLGNRGISTADAFNMRLYSDWEYPGFPACALRDSMP